MNSILDLQDESDINSYEFQDYDLLRYRGGGSYAHVFDAKNKWSGQNVVVKTLSKYGVDEQRSLLEREISLLQRLAGSPHVIKLHQVVEDTKAWYTHMIYEMMDCDLEALMKTKDGRHKTISHELMRSFLHQICQGVADCHSRGVIHRDLKTANLLVDEKESKIKIADFGLGRLFTVLGEIPTPGQAAFCYRAPEILLNSRKLYASADMWSVGCIFGEMLLGKIVFDAQTNLKPSRLDEPAQFHEIVRQLGDPEMVWPQVTSLPGWKVYQTWKSRASLERKKDVGSSTTTTNLKEVASDMGEAGRELLWKMLTYDPAKRITAHDALKHPYFEGL